MPLRGPGAEGGKSKEPESGCGGIAGLSHQGGDSASGRALAEGPIGVTLRRRSKRDGQRGWVVYKAPAASGFWSACGKQREKWGRTRIEGEKNAGENVELPYCRHEATKKH